MKNQNKNKIPVCLYCILFYTILFCTKKTPYDDDEEYIQTIYLATTTLTTSNKPYFSSLLTPLNLPYDDSLIKTPSIRLLQTSLQKKKFTIIIYIIIYMNNEKIKQKTSFHAY